MRLALSGASGLVGRRLAADLERDGVSLSRLVRPGGRTAEGDVRWDPVRGEIDSAALEGVDAVVHLAGEPIAEGRWSAARKRRIRESRTLGTRLLADTLARLERPPRVLVSASAIGYYGSRGDTWLDEDAPAGSGFLAEVCVEWEKATAPAADAGIRVVLPRIGIVLAREGGVLGRMLLPFRIGLGGRLGDGRQYTSWITLDDLVAVLRFALDTGSLVGATNASAPAPATNAELTRVLGRVLGRPTLLPLPAFALRLALGEMADELLLSGARARPSALLRSGFEFAQPELEPALECLLRAQ